MKEESLGHVDQGREIEGKERIIQKQQNEIESLQEMLKIARENKMPSKAEATDQENTHLQSQVASLKI